MSQRFAAGLRFVTAVLVVPIATVCGRGDSAERVEAAFTRHDSAGIVVVTTEGRAARRPLAWTIDPEHDLQIGRVDGPEEFLFHRIDGVTSRTDGTIVVVDGSEQVRYFDAHGTFLQSFGRNGSGPGEFRSVILVSSAPSDSLLLYDPRLGRFTLLDRSGTGFATIDTRSAGSASPEPRYTPLARAGNNVLVEIRSIWIMGVPGPHARTRKYALLDPTNGDTTTLGVFRGDQTFVTRDLGELLSELWIPFTATASATAANGEIYINDGLHPEIRIYDATGKVRGFARLREPVDRVTENEYAAFVAAHARTPVLERVYHAMPMPDTAPAFDALLVASDGWIWAKTYNADDDAAPVWMLFDTARVARGTIVSPAGLQVGFIAHDFVLGWWSDSLGVEYVRRHRIRRH